VASAPAADGPPPDDDNRILPPSASAAVAGAATLEVGDGAPSPDAASGTTEAQRKPTIGDPRPLMARTAAQKAENNGASSAAAINGDQEQAHAEAESAQGRPEPAQPAAPVVTAAPEVPAPAVDSSSPGTENLA
jgi:hypothetical protein